MFQAWPILKILPRAKGICGMFLCAYYSSKIFKKT